MREGGPRRTPPRGPAPRDPPARAPPKRWWTPLPWPCTGWHTRAPSEWRACARCRATWRAGRWNSLRNRPARCACPLTPHTGPCGTRDAGSLNTWRQCKVPCIEGAAGDLAVPAVLFGLQSLELFTVHHWAYLCQSSVQVQYIPVLALGMRSSSALDDAYCLKHPAVWQPASAVMFLFHVTVLFLQAVLFIRDVDRSILGRGENALDHYKKLRRVTDLLVNGILCVRQLLKQKRAADADGASISGGRPCVLQQNTVLCLILSEHVGAVQPTLMYGVVVDSYEGRVKATRSRCKCMSGVGRFVFFPGHLSFRHLLLRSPGGRLCQHCVVEAEGRRCIQRAQHDCCAVVQSPCRQCHRFGWRGTSRHHRLPRSTPRNGRSLCRPSAHGQWDLCHPLHVMPAPLSGQSRCAYIPPALSSTFALYYC